MNSKTILITATGAIAAIGLTMGTIAYAQMGGMGGGMMGQTTQQQTTPANGMMGQPTQGQAAAASDMHQAMTGKTTSQNSGNNMNGQGTSQNMENTMHGQTTGQNIHGNMHAQTNQKK